MTHDYIPDSDLVLLDWLKQFLMTADNNQAALGLSDEELLALQDRADAYFNAFSDCVHARQAARTATTQKDVSRKNMVDLVRLLSNRIQVLPQVGPPLKIELGLNPRTAVRNFSPPVPPEHLMVTVLGGNIHRLEWQRSDNKPRTVFQIEARESGTDWRIVGITTGLRYEHLVQNGGQYAVYRVRALRGKKASLPCVEVVANHTATLPVLSRAA